MKRIFLFAAVFGAAMLSAAPFEVSIRDGSEDALCHAGEKVRFSLTAKDLAKDAASSGGVVAVTMDNFGDKVFARKEWKPSEEPKMVLEGSLDEPGFLHVRAISSPKMRGSVWSMGNEKGNNGWSVGCDPEKIRPGSSRPADFDAYWDGERARLEREVPVDLRREKLPDISDDAFDVWKVSVATFGGKRTWGFLVEPKDSAKGPLPMHINIPGAGPAMSEAGMKSFKKPGEIHLVVNVHPFEPAKDAAGQKKLYAEQDRACAKKYGCNYAIAGGAVGKEEFFFHDALLGIDRVVTWATALPKVDRKRVRYSGGSQGGGMGIMLCALNPAITRACFYVPALTDLCGFAVGRQSGWPLLVERQKGDKAKEIAKSIAPYFDAAHFAPRVKIPVRVVVGFADTTCPPTCVYAAYNALGSKEKSIRNGLGMGHGTFPQIRRETEEWLRESKTADCASHACAVTLENPAMQIHFADASKGFAINGIVNRLAGDTRFVSGWPYTDRGNFWSLEFRRQTAAGTNETIWVNNLAPCVAKRVVDAANEKVFVWEGVKLPGSDASVDVTTDVRLVEDGSAKWRIRVDNKDAEWSLGLVRYPVFAGVVKDREADVLIPTGNLGAKVVTNFVPLSYSTYHMRSPAGWCPMMTAYMIKDAGLYIAAHDPKACNKDLYYWGNSFYFQSPVENAGVPGKAAGSTGFEVTTACYKGDWWQAAKLYRAWALRQKWTSKGPIVKRSDYPKVMAEADIWLRVLFTDYRNYEQALKIWPDVKLGVRHYCWHVQKYDTCCPEYQPRDGVEKFWARAKTDGVLVTPYVNGRLWDRKVRSFLYAKCDVCQMDDGSEFVEFFTPRCAVMCPIAAKWQKTLYDMGLEVVDGFGANGIYYDQIGVSGWAGCRNPEHGHPLEGGSWWYEGYRTVLERVRPQLAPKDIPITSEGPCEVFMDQIDGALIVGRNHKSDDVPFLTAVYGGYTTYFCIEEEADDEPQAIFARQMQGVMNGQVSGSWDDKRLFDANPAKRTLKAQADVLYRAAKFRKAAREYVAYGTLEDELRTLEPNEKVTFTHQLTRGRAPGKPPTKVDYRSIIGVVRENVEHDRAAVFAANVTDATRKFSFKAPGVEPVVRTIPGEPVPEIQSENGIVSLSLKPQEIVWIEFKLLR